MTKKNSKPLCATPCNVNRGFCLVLYLDFLDFRKLVHDETFFEAYAIPRNVNRGFCLVLLIQKVEAV
jgi:hypothetical protein